MRLPKSVQIAGQTWRVISRRSGERGGAFYTNPGIITVSAPANDDEAMQVFLHEVLEAILTTTNCRYEREDDGNHLFCFDHRKLREVHKDLYGALRPMLMRGAK